MFYKNYVLKAISFIQYNRFINGNKYTKYYTIC